MVDALQLGIVGGAIEVAISGTGNVLERLGVDLHRHVDVLNASRCGHRVRCHLVGSHTDGVDSDAEALGYLGCRHRRNVTGVVAAVGQEDDHLALGLGVLQSADSIGETHTHRRSVVDESTGSNVGTSVLQQSQQTGVVGGHRTLGEGLTSKDGKTDIVVGTARDKLVSHILGSLHTIGFQVFCQHRGRDVHRHHDVDALHRLVVPGVVGLRTSHRTDDEHEAQTSEHHGQMDKALAQALGSIGKLPGVAQPHGRLVLLPVQEIP